MVQTANLLRQRLRATAMDALLDAAEKVMVDKGYDGATMHDLAAAAGCATGTFYTYFRNKDELFQALVARHLTALVAAMRAAEAGVADPLGKLRAHIRASLDYAHDHLPFLNLFFNCMPLRRAHLRQRMGRAALAEDAVLRNHSLDLIRQGQKAGTVRRDLSPEVLFDFIDTVMLAMLDQMSAGLGPRGRAERLRVAWALVSGGIGAGRTSP